MPTPDSQFATIPPNIEFTLLNGQTLQDCIDAIETGLGETLEAKYLFERSKSDPTVGYLFSRSDFEPKSFGEILDRQARYIRTISRLADAQRVKYEFYEQTPVLADFDEDDYNYLIRRVAEHIDTPGIDHLELDYQLTLEEILPSFHELQELYEQNFHLENFDIPLQAIIFNRWDDILHQIPEFLEAALSIYEDEYANLDVLYDGGPNPWVMIGSCLFIVGLIGLGLGSILPPMTIMSGVIMVLFFLLRQSIEIGYPADITDWWSLGNNITTASLAEYSGHPKDTVCILPEGSSRIGFLKQHRAWGTINLGRDPDHIAIYIGSPKRSVDYIFERVNSSVARSLSYYNEIKDAEHIEEEKEMHEVDNIHRIQPPLPSSNVSIRGPRYLKLGTLQAANTLQEALY